MVETMLRSAILYLASQQGLRDIAVHQPLARRLALRFVAGERLEQAIEVVRGLNSRGMHASLDFLGENTTNTAEAKLAAEEYLEILDRIAQARVDSNISIKLTQLGLDLDVDLARENLRRIVARAVEWDNFVRVDMESSAYTQRTLDLVRRAHAEFGNHVGPVIQAYLYRSAADVEDLIQRGMRVRLCKGAYKEPAAVAFPWKKDVDANLIRLAEQLLLKGNYPGLATHDEKIIDWVLGFVESRKIPSSRFEFQMLYGIRRGLQEKLASAGHNVRVYVPYGTQWYPYLMRRLAERPANLVFVLSNLLRG